MNPTKRGVSSGSALATAPKGVRYVTETIWAASNREYSDGGVTAFFATKQQAEEYCQIHNGDGRDYMEYYVEEYPFFSEGEPYTWHTMHRMGAWVSGIEAIKAEEVFQSSEIHDGDPGWDECKDVKNMTAPSPHSFRQGVIYVLVEGLNPELVAKVFGDAVFQNQERLKMELSK